MPKQSKSDILTDLILEVFRLNGRLIAAGDALVARIDLTSARWQVIGAVALAKEARPVAHIAQAMGLTRQSVQRIVDELALAGFVSFQPNPHHKRAKLVALTPKGTAAADAATRLQKPWAEGLAAVADRQALEATLRTLARLRAHLEDTSGETP
jgi:DNA-binding MarR family transcriptional regulator